MQKELIAKAKETLTRKFGMEQTDTFYIAYATFIPLLIIPEDEQIAQQINEITSNCNALILRDVRNVYALEYGRTELDIYPIIRKKGIFTALHIEAIQSIDNAPEHILNQIISALTEEEFNKKRHDDHIAAASLSQAYANLLTSSNIDPNKLKK